MMTHYVNTTNACGAEILSPGLILYCLRDQAPDKVPGFLFLHGVESFFDAGVVQWQNDTLPTCRSSVRPRLPAPKEFLKNCQKVVDSVKTRCYNLS